MHISLTTRLLALLSSFVLLAGCAIDQHYSRNLVDANTAQENGFNQLLLMNILRSRDREPRAYSHFSALRGSVTATPSLAASIPFGQGRAGDGIVNTLTPGLNATPGISDDVLPLDDQEFYRGILTPVSNATWALYQDQNWPEDLLFHIFVEDIKVEQNDYAKIETAADGVCATANTSARDREAAWQCAARAARKLDAGKAPCDVTTPWENQVGGKTIIELSNEPKDFCERSHFEAFVFSLLVLGYHIDKNEAEAVGPPLQARAFEKLDWPFKLKDGDISIAANKDANGHVTSYSLKETGGYSVHLLNYPKPPLPTPPRGGVRAAHPAEPQSENALVYIAPLSDILKTTKKTDEDKPKVYITTRSPDGMIYYLGEVARAVRNGEQPVAVQGSGEVHLPLLNVVPGDIDHASVSVAYDGEKYAIPHGDRSFSMQAFELLKQVFALYNKAPAAPATTSVTVVP